MTFDREPDLDNANVGMPVFTWRILRKLSEWGASFFIAFLPVNSSAMEGESMKKSNYLRRMVMLAMFVALGTVISPILRIEGMCPMAHLINVTCAVFLGPWYALLCAVLIGIIRMMIMGIPPLALTGAVFGATLSGVFYRLSKGKIIAAVLGEIIGTGIIGAIVSYPVMTYLWGKEGLTWFFYVPSFICGTLIGGSIAFIILKRLQVTGALTKMQNALMDEPEKEEKSA